MDGTFDLTTWTDNCSFGPGPHFFICRHGLLPGFHDKRTVASNTVRVKVPKRCPHASCARTTIALGLFILFVLWGHCIRLHLGPVHTGGGAPCNKAHANYGTHVLCERGLEICEMHREWHQYSSDNTKVLIASSEIAWCPLRNAGKAGRHITDYNNKIGDSTVTSQICDLFHRA